jgi:hypothetical protein
MPFPRKNAVVKSKKLKQAESDGVAALYAYLKAKPGRAAMVARRTEMNPATITRLSHDKAPILMEAAILIELATDRALLAETLCPSMRHVLGIFRVSEVFVADDVLPILK